jgi:hypothetical protein
MLARRRGLSENLSPPEERSNDIYHQVIDSEALVRRLVPTFAFDEETIMLRCGEVVGGGRVLLADVTRR